MAILKKKMAGKPAMKKAPMRKAKQGDSVAKGDTIRTEYNKDKELGEVVKRETGAERLKKFYKRDYFGADAAKTKAGKDVRKVLNTVAKVSYTPHALAEMLLLTGSTARANKRDAKAAAAADSTSVKRKMGGKVKKYQAGGVVGKQPKAKMVDPKGAFTKVQKRTLAQKKK
jgi:hypothetical protein